MFRSLNHKLKLSTIVNCLISDESQLLRRLCTAASTNPAKNIPENHRNITKHNLFRRLSAVTATGEKISDVLHEITRNGKQLKRSELVYCLKELRKYNRRHLCLEVFEWMDKGNFSYSAKDYALRLNIMSKVKSVDEVEKYLDNIHPDFKNQDVYGALLNCYCTQMLTDKALALFEKMVELNYASSAVDFNDIMGLYLKVGKPEKVPSLIEEMKQRKIPLTNYTYYIWIQSYQYLRDLEGVERVMLEVQEQDGMKEDWQIYRNLAAVYIELGKFEKANSALDKVGELLLKKPRNADRKAYHYLIAMYASTGNLQSVNHAWENLNKRYEVCQKKSYLTMLRALSKLDDIQGLKERCKEFESRHLSYDDRLLAIVIDAYLRHDMLEEAEQLLKDVKGKTEAEEKIKSAHVIFMKYFVEKHLFDSALKHMEAAMAAEWKPYAENLDHFFEHLKEVKDVESAEKFCSTLEKVQPLDSRIYLRLLQTYVAAGISAPKMRQRIQENGVDISIELEDLLQKIC